MFRQLRRQPACLPGLAFLLLLAAHAGCGDDDDVLPSRDLIQMGPEPTVVITEIQAAPCQGDDLGGEWFEVVNLSLEPVSLDGWLLRDDTGESHRIALPAQTLLLVGTGSFVVLAASEDPDGQGRIPVTYVYDGFTLADEADEIVLLDAFDRPIDSVRYDATWIQPGCGSLQLSPDQLDAEANDRPQNWCSSLAGGGDPGSPAAPNPDCQVEICGDGVVTFSEQCDDGQLNSDVVEDVCRSDCTPPGCGDDVVDSGEECDEGPVATETCSADCRAAPPRPGDLVITEIMRRPSGDEDRDWLEIASAGEATFVVSGCVLRDGAGQTHLIGAERLLVGPPRPLLLARSAEELTEAGVAPDYLYSDLALRASGAISLECDGRTVDAVNFGDDSDWPDDRDFSMSLSASSTDSSSNDAPGNWCSARGPYGDGSSFGSPGLRNPICGDWRVDRCRLEAGGPDAEIVVEASDRFRVQARLLESGITDRSPGIDPHPLLIAEAGYGPPSSSPKDNPDWTWTRAAPGPDWEDSTDPDFDEYRATITATQRGTYDLAVRASRDRGLTWVYCDRATGAAGEDGSENGYQPANATHLEVLGDRVWGSLDPSRLAASDLSLESGDELAAFRSLLRDGGHELARSAPELTTEYLDQVGAIYVAALSAEEGLLSAAEQSALLDRIAAGGTLIVAADPSALGAYDSFTTPLGLEGWRQESTSGVSDVTRPHPITRGVSQIRHGTAAALPLEGDAAVLAETDEQTPFLLVLEPAGGFPLRGRVLVIGDGDVFADAGIDQNATLVENIIAWSRPVAESVDFPLDSDQWESDIGEQALWHVGDAVSGVRDTQLDSVSRADLHVVVAENRLTCDDQHVRVRVNEVEIGTLTIEPGLSEIETSFVFDWVDGPAYTIRFENARSVTSGCGSAKVRTVGSTVTFVGVGSDGGQ